MARWWGLVLAWVNYSASSSVQPVEVLSIIKILFCVVPVVLYVGMFIMLSLYKLSDARVEAINQQLIKHRAAQGEDIPAATTAASHLRREQYVHSEQPDSDRI